MGRTIVIEDVDSATFARLESAARDRGVDVTALARALLQQSVGSSATTSHELDSLEGTWSDEDAKAFDATTSKMRAIDPESWR